MSAVTHNTSLLALFVLILALYTPAAGAQWQSIDPNIRNKIDNFVNNVFLPSAQISKLGLSIVKDDGSVLYATGYGAADEERGIPTSNQSQFLIGSATKMFTATLTVKILNEAFPELGEAVLDTPIRKLIPVTNFTLVDKIRSERTTFRDLLAHRMCLSRDDIQFLAEPFSSVAEIVYRQRFAVEVSQFRSSFQYNNLMYVIVGELIGNLANMSYTELMHGFLKDIGMFNSALVSKSDNFSSMPLRAKPYYNLNGACYPMNSGLITRLSSYAAAGGLYVSPIDMTRFMRLHLNKGKINGRQIIPEHVMVWLTKSSNTNYSTIEFKTSDDDVVVTAYGYGLGMMLATYKGFEYNHHDGHFPPYLSLVSLFPSQNLGIFSSTNESPPMANQKALHVFIFELLSGARNTAEKATIFLNKSRHMIEERNMNRNAAFQRLLATTDKLNSTSCHDDLVGMVGKYGNGSAGDVKVIMKFNPRTNTTTLYVQYGKWYRGWMEQVGCSTFTITWDTNVIQEYYAMGISDGLGYVKIANGTLQFLYVFGDEPYVTGTFTKGFSYEKLPVIPWTGNYC